MNLIYKILLLHSHNSSIPSIQSVSMIVLDSVILLKVDFELEPSLSHYVRQNYCLCAPFLTFLLSIHLIAYWSGTCCELQSRRWRGKEERKWSWLRCHPGILKLSRHWREGLSSDKQRKHLGLSSRRMH